MPKKDKSGSKGALLAQSPSKVNKKGGSSVREAASRVAGSLGSLWSRREKQSYTAVDGVQSNAVPGANHPSRGKAAGKGTPADRVAVQGTPAEQEDLSTMIEGDRHYGTCTEDNCYQPQSPALSASA
jgi:hypothetical protein